MKNILLGITGGIAAYKTPHLVRLFKKAGYEVRIIATKNVLKLVSEHSLATVSGHPVRIDTFGNSGHGVDHIDIARWADVLVIAPATANIMAKASCGIADDMLSTVFLAVSCPVVMAPGMNDIMWQSSSVQANLAVLKSRGIMFIGPEPGELACNTSGMGRMSEPETIVQFVQNFPTRIEKLRGKRVLITAGATREYFDPARFWSNPSSGRMGNELARFAADSGAHVTICHGFMEVKPASLCEAIHAPDAASMYLEVSKRFRDFDVVVMAAAVSDWTFPNTAELKSKKDALPQELQLQMVRTKDILASISAENTDDGPIIIGFAAETASGNDLVTLARKKLERKGCDMIIANDITPGKSAFGNDNNHVIIVNSDGRPPSDFEGPKSTIVRDIWERICEYFD